MTLLLLLRLRVHQCHCGSASRGFLGMAEAPTSTSTTRSTLFLRNNYDDVNSGVPLTLRSATVGPQNALAPWLKHSSCLRFFARQSPFLEDKLVPLQFRPRALVFRQTAAAHSETVQKSQWDTPQDASHRSSFGGFVFDVACQTKFMTRKSEAMALDLWLGTTNRKRARKFHPPLTRSTGKSNCILNQDHL